MEIQKMLIFFSPISLIVCIRTSYKIFYNNPTLANKNIRGKILIP